MEEMLKLFSNSALGTGSAIAAAVIGIAVYLPKLLNAVKTDRIDGNVLDRLLAHEKRMNEMDKTIHEQQVKVTRLVVVVTHLKGLVVRSELEMPGWLEEEINSLTSAGDK